MATGSDERDTGRLRQYLEQVRRYLDIDVDVRYSCTATIWRIARQKNRFSQWLNRLEFQSSRLLALVGGNFYEDTRIGLGRFLRRLIVTDMRYTKKLYIWLSLHHKLKPS
jgi:hypothetical protein